MSENTDEVEGTVETPQEACKIILENLTTEDLKALRESASTTIIEAYDEYIDAISDLSYVGGVSEAVLTMSIAGTSLTRELSDRNEELHTVTACTARSLVDCLKALFRMNVFDENEVREAEDKVARVKRHLVAAKSEAASLDKMYDSKMK